MAIQVPVLAIPALDAQPTPDAAPMPPPVVPPPVPTPALEAVPLIAPEDLKPAYLRPSKPGIQDTLMAIDQVELPAPDASALKPLAAAPPALPPLEDLASTLPEFGADFPDIAELPVTEEAPSLTLGEIDSSDEEILDKTLLIDPTAPPSPAPAPASVDHDGFSSAKDAISRILGGLDAPAPSQSSPARIARSRSVDMEATLDALEQTLGKPTATTPEPLPSLAQAAAAGTATTVRISIEEIRKSMEAAPPLEPTSPAISAKPTFTPDADTLHGDKSAPKFPDAGLPPSSGAQDPNLLKVQVGSEVYNNVTVDQLTAWIEQGRVLEFHQVARQFSDHWLEAAKVPSLRPVFERIRRVRPDGTPGSDADGGQKKGLFGGIFGR